MNKRILTALALASLSSGAWAGPKTAVMLSFALDYERGAVTQKIRPRILTLDGKEAAVGVGVKNNQVARITVLPTVQAKAVLCKLKLHVQHPGQSFDQTMTVTLVDGQLSQFGFEDSETGSNIHLDVTATIIPAGMRLREVKDGKPVLEVDAVRY